MILSSSKVLVAMPVSMITRNTKAVKNENEKGFSERKFLGFTLEEWLISLGMFLGLVLVFVDGIFTKQVNDNLNNISNEGKNMRTNILQGFSWLGVV
jgi:hypothetical protein